MKSRNNPAVIRFLRDFHEETIKAHQEQLLVLQEGCTHPSSDNGQCPDCGKVEKVEE